MTAARLPRWAVSFADLALLLLGFFVLLHAGSAREVAAGARAAFSSEAVQGPLLSERAEMLFFPGEARLTPVSRARIMKIGAGAARGGRRLVIDSVGRDSAARRFDGWELAAARAAAVARALNEGGLAEDRVSIALQESRPDKEVRTQSLTIRLGA